MALAVTLGLTATAAVPVWQLHRQEALHPFSKALGRVGWRSSLISLAGLGLALLMNLLPLWAGLPGLILLLLASLWLSCRLALPLPDRESLGSVARRLRLI